MEPRVACRRCVFEQPGPPSGEPALLLQEEGVINDNQGLLVIKDYSENQGIEDAMRSEGILGEPDGAVIVGHTICSVYIIDLPKGVKL